MIIKQLLDVSSKVCRHGLILTGLACGWLTAMAVVMALTEPSRAALLVVDDVGSLRAMPADVRWLRGRDHVLVVTSEKRGYVEDLYRAGAWLVLPALQNGCLDL